MEANASGLAQHCEISDIFWKPLLPKITILGLEAVEYDSFRNLILKAFENLFVVDFSEQVGLLTRK